VTNKVPRKQNYKWPRKGEKDRFCQFCGRMDGLIRKYGLQVCRECFREKAEDLGFNKYG
jgi:small subunit ribosomal protein S29e